MKIEIHRSNNTTIAEIISDEVVINNVQEALDLMADCGYHGASGIILRQENLAEDFFNLRTGLAGDILQKFSNYRMKLSIIGDFSEVSSKSLRDFIFESNKLGTVTFVNSPEDALGRMAK